VHLGAGLFISLVPRYLLSPCSFFFIRNTDAKLECVPVILLHFFDCSSVQDYAVSNDPSNVSAVHTGKTPWHFPLVKKDLHPII